MKNFGIFVDAVNFIEDNLCRELSQEEIAQACYCSLSALQKVWRFCTRIGLKEYAAKRRLTRSAEELLHTEQNITDIALKYGYNSPEVFTRAFRRLWGVSPSDFRKNRHISGIFPRIIPDENKLKGGVFMGRKVDVSELYDVLKANPDSYVLCCDIDGLMPINDNLGIGAGDAVIREAFRRIDEAAGSDMAAFRIGGDEFALVTFCADKSKVAAIAERILAHNGESVPCEGRDVPVNLRIGAVRLTTEHLRCGELFDRLQEIIDQTPVEANKAYFFDE